MRVTEAGGRGVQRQRLRRVDARVLGAVGIALVVIDLAFVWGADGLWYWFLNAIGLSGVVLTIVGAVLVVRRSNW